MTRSPLFLAALASAAVPGLDPASVEGVTVNAEDDYERAHVRDTQEREWVVTAPRTPVAAALLEDVDGLLRLLVRRLDLALPVAEGYAVVPQGRAVVNARPHGRPLDFGGLEPGSLAEELGRTLAHVHNVEHVLFEEAGRPFYDAQAHRARLLADLDRAAATGHVPTSLLTRWEQRLEDVSLWRFAPTAVHGSFAGANVLVAFPDDDDSATGRVSALLGWEQSRVADPADDFADLVRQAPHDALAAVHEAYALARVEQPDPHLLTRARLAAELAPVRRLLRATAAGDTAVVEQAARRLRVFDRLVHDEEEARAAEEAEARAARELAEQERLEQERADQERAERERLEAEQVERERVRREALETPTTEVPEYDWDATQPHQPFPQPGATTAISVVDAEEPLTPAAPADEGPTGEAPAADEGEAEAPAEEPDVDAATVFEIDAVEPFDEGEDDPTDGAVDGREGASEFVPVHRPERRQD